MRVAALDLGTNTFLLLIAEMQGRDIVKVLVDETRVTRLGQGVHQNRRFHPEALKRAEKVLVEYAQFIAHHHCDKVVAVATSAARDVENGTELLKLGENLGIPIRIISGSQEAEITFSGATCDLKDPRGVRVIDVGGGSTEVIGHQTDGTLLARSVDVGSVRLTESLLPQHPCPPSSLRDLERFVREEFFSTQVANLETTGAIVAVAGTPTTLVCLELEKNFQEKLVNGFRLSLSRVWWWRDHLAQMSVDERQKLPGMQPSRADVMVAGLTILAIAIEFLGGQEIWVSTKGVRYGVIKAWPEFLSS